MSKPVVIRFEAEMVVQVPDDWDDDMVDSHYNESSHCLCSEARQLARECDAHPRECNLCTRAKASFVRFASEEDVEAMK